MKTQITKDILEGIAKNPSLSSFIQSLDSRKATTPKAYIYDERARDKRMNKLSGDDILDTWVGFLNQHLLHDKSLTRDKQEFYHRIWDLEESQIEKYGPQGGHPPMSEVWDEIYGKSFDSEKAQILHWACDGVHHPVTPSLMCEHNGEDPVNADEIGEFLSTQPLEALILNSSLDVEDILLFQRAAEYVVQDYKRNRVWNLVPANPSSVVSELLAEKKLTTNSGFPIFNTRRAPAVLKGTLESLVSGDFKWYPAIPLFRYYNGKLRGVWMYPFATNVDEAQYVRPFMKAIQKSPLIDGFYAPWKGFDAVKSVISKEYANTNTYIAATDYSSTDRHFSIDYSVICGWVVAQTFHPRFRAGLFSSLIRMHTIPLVINNDEMLVGAHGVASGSEWTNTIETVGGNIMGYYAMLLAAKKMRGLYGIGDDMCHVVNASMSSDEFKEFISRVGKQIGQEIKPEKTTADYHYVKSLQRLMQRGYYVDGTTEVRGVYPTVRALKSVVWPERWHKKAYDDEGNLDEYDKFDFCCRIYQILENTCDHPLFDYFVAFVIDGNVELINFAGQKDQIIDHYYERSKRLNALVDTYNIEYASRKMSKFRSIQSARSYIDGLQSHALNIKVIRRAESEGHNVQKYPGQLRNAALGVDTDAESE
jgi:hypothetical protein